MASSAPIPTSARRLNPASPAYRLNSPAVEIPINLPMLPRWDELADWMRRIDRNQIYTNRGPLCIELERRLETHYLGESSGRGAVCLTANASLGLVASLLALDLPAGSICALPAWTFVGSAEAVVMAGLTPYLLDVDLETWALNPSSIDQQIVAMPKPPAVIMAVAPFGAPLDTAAWSAFSTESGIPVVIDAAGGFDTAQACQLPTVVSLHATKALAVGEGGFVLSTNEVFLQRVRQITNHGLSATRIAHRSALDAKMSEYHAAIGLAQLGKWQTTRRAWMRIAHAYHEAFAAHSAIDLMPGFGRSWISSTAILRFADRSASDISNALAEHNVESRRWWHCLINQHPAFVDAGHANLDNAGQLAEEVLALPCYLNLRESMIRRVSNAVTAVLAEVLPNQDLS